MVLNARFSYEMGSKSKAILVNQGELQAMRRYEDYWRNGHHGHNCMVHLTRVCHDCKSFFVTKCIDDVLCCTCEAQDQDYIMGTSPDNWDDYEHEVICSNCDRNCVDDWFYPDIPRYTFICDAKGHVPSEAIMVKRTDLAY